MPSLSVLIPVYNDEGQVVLDHDEFPRPGTTLEGLAGLKPAEAIALIAPLLPSR